MDTNVEQLKSSDELLDEVLLAADQPAEEPPVAAEVVAEEAPEQPAGEPPLDSQAILKEKEELAKRVEDLSKERDGLVDRVKRLRGKGREARTTLQSQLEAVQTRLQELESRQTPTQDPLKAWMTNPENEGAAPPEEVLQAHDQFVISQVRPVQTHDVKTAAQRVDQSMLRASPNEQMIVQAAVDRKFITEADVLAMASSDNPAQVAVAIARERFEDFGTDQELDLLNRLFPTQAPVPAPIPTPPVSAAPRHEVKPVVRQTKETTDEAEYVPAGFGPNHKAITDMFFRR